MGNPIGRWSTGAPACPQCHQIDLARTASSIVAAGTATGRYHGSTLVSTTNGWGSGMTSGTTFEQTHLAQRLSPPARPKQNWVMGCLGASVLGTVSLTACAIVGFSVDRTPGAMNSGTSTAGAAILGIGCNIIVPLLIVLWFVWRRRVFMRSPAMARWNEAMVIWQQVWYCGRCDGVYMPDGSRFTPLAFLPGMAAYVAPQLTPAR